MDLYHLKYLCIKQSNIQMLCHNQKEVHKPKIFLKSISIQPSNQNRLLFQCRIAEQTSFKSNKFNNQNKSNKRDSQSNNRIN